MYTGDEGYVNEKKELFIVDRIKVSRPLVTYTSLRAPLTVAFTPRIQELIKVRGFQGETPRANRGCPELPD